jgi:beta-xylosidase
MIMTKKLAQRFVEGCGLFFYFFVFILGNSLAAQQDISSIHNPVIWADVPDPSVIRVGDTYYMSSTTMHMNPGVPIMKSSDLVNWEIINYVYDTLGKIDTQTLSNGENEYGRGSWASSIRYHNRSFYVATFSYTTQKTYIFRTADIESGSWEKFTLEGLYHDPSLFFDEDRAFLVYGIDDIRITELTADATALKEKGIDQVLIPDSKSIMETDEFYVPAEGAHIHRINDAYFVTLITWPATGMRTQLTYRSSELLGDYTGKIVFEDNGGAQGGLIDTPEGDWYGFMFKDHGSVGRIPMIVPVTWRDGWPVFGKKGKMPEQLRIKAGNKGVPGIVASDEFNGDSRPDRYNEETDILKGLSLVWQWNHVPDAQYWSLDERPGYLRITNGEIATSFTDTRNTLTQRTFGPHCTGTVLMDFSNLKDGDVAGLGALQGTHGYLAVKKEQGSTYLEMVKGSPDSIHTVERHSINQDHVYFRISFDFTDLTDAAYFYYSMDGNSWQQLGNDLQMRYTLDHFMGYRFALFNYATKATGGYVDFDYFDIESQLFSLDN